MDKFFDDIKAKWEKVKDYFKGIGRDWAEGRKPRAAGKVILPCLPVALLGFITYLVAKNWEAIVNFCLGLLVVVCLVGGAVCKLNERKREAAERLELERQATIREKADTQEKRYQQMGKIVWAVARELGPLGIVPPNRLADIYSPTRIIPKRGGEVLLGLYLLQKARDDVDTDLLVSTMQTKINQKLSAGDFPDIDEKYDGLAIDKVKGSDGFVEVYTALKDRAYYSYLASCDLDKDTPPPSVDRRDIRY